MLCPFLFSFSFLQILPLITVIYVSFALRFYYIASNLHRYGNQIIKSTKSRYKIKVDNSVKSWDSSKSILTDWRIIYPFTALEYALGMKVADLFCHTIYFNIHNFTKILQNKFS